jgi:2-aminoadipate transaminase
MLHLVSESLLDPGDFVCCGAPSYFVYLGLLKNLGVRPLGVEVDDCGMVPESLEEMLDRQDKGGHLARTKAVYLVSYFDNPCSLTLAAERRATIVEMARRWSRGGAAGHRVYVIEDAAYRELRYDGDDVASLRAADPDGRTVIHTGTFSKSFSPGVRVGWGILPAELVEPVCNQKGNIDFGSPNFNQYLMAKVLDEGVYEPHVAQIRASYREKLQAMLAACREHLGGMPQVDWIQPRGGLYVWLTLPDAIDAGPAGPLFQQALDRGVLYVPGQYFFPGEGAARRANTIRLSFGVQPPDKIHHGVQALAEAIDAL